MRKRSYPYSIRVVSVSILFLLIIVSVLLHAPATYAQSDATATQGSNPLISIPVATLLPTSTFSPDQIVQALPTYGLQASDLPSNFMAAVDNKSMNLADMVTRLKKNYPDQASLADSLGALYQTYGVLGSSFADYFVQSCSGQTIFGLGTWIRALPNADNAQKLLMDGNVAGLYLGLFNWRKTTLDGIITPAYETDVPKTMCATPSTQYTVEFTVDRFLFSVKLYAPRTTDHNLVEATLNGTIKVLVARMSAVSPAASQNAPNPTQIASVTPTLSGKNQILFADQFKSNTNAWAVGSVDGGTVQIGNGKLLFQAQNYVSDLIPYDVSGNFHIEATFVSVNDINEVGFYVGTPDGATVQRHYIGFTRDNSLNNIGSSIRVNDKIDGANHVTAYLYNSVQWRDGTAFTISLDVSDNAIKTYFNGKFIKAFDITRHGNALGIYGGRGSCCADNSFYLSQITITSLE